MHEHLFKRSTDVDAMNNSQQTTPCEQDKTTTIKDSSAPSSLSNSTTSVLYETPAPTRTSTTSIEADNTHNDSSKSLPCKSCLRQKKPASASLSFTVSTITGSVYMVKCRETDTFAFLQFKLFSKTGMCPDRQKIIMNEKELVCDEDKTLKQCGLVNGSKLILMFKIATGFHMQARPIVKAHVRKPCHTIQEDFSTSSSRKREAGWWKQKQEEHKGMKSKVDELKKKLAAQKALKLQQKQAE